MLIPSFTLPPVWDDRSTINRHLPALPFFGMTPKGLQCTPRASVCSTLPTATTLPASLSLSSYPRTTSGWSLTDERFCLACLNSPGSPWYPTRNPCRMPLVIHSTSCLSGCSASIVCHASARSGVRISQASVCSALPLTSSPAPAPASSIRHLQAKAQFLSFCSTDLPTPLS